MGKTICGVDCTKCLMNRVCEGCAETGERPFLGTCGMAQPDRQGQTTPGGRRKGVRAFFNALGISDINVMMKLCEPDGYRERLMAAFNALGIPDMDEVTELHALRGAFVNLPLTLPGGAVVKFWDDDRILLGNQLEKKGTDRCYGLAADERYLMVCEYGEGGSDAQLVVFRRWNSQYN